MASEGLALQLGLAQATAQPLRSLVTSLTPDDLERTNSTSAAEYTLDRYLKILIIWLINAHYGELLGLKGCQGLKSYP